MSRTPCRIIVFPEWWCGTAEFAPNATIDSKLSPSPPNSNIFSIIICLRPSSDMPSIASLALRHSICLNTSSIIVMAFLIFCFSSSHLEILMLSKYPEEYENVFFGKQFCKECKYFIAILSSTVIASSALNSRLRDVSRSVMRTQRSCRLGFFRRLLRRWASMLLVFEKYLPSSSTMSSCWLRIIAQSEGWNHNKYRNELSVLEKSESVIKTCCIILLLCNR